MRKQTSFKAALFYHDIFDYPLTGGELEKWMPGKLFPAIKSKLTVAKKGRFYFLKGRDKIVKIRLEKEVCSRKKMRVAWKAAKLLGRIPTVKFVGVTGSLAMQAAGKYSDIDLMIITAKGCLWTTRLISYLATTFGGIRKRKAGDREEKDRVCLNIWLDEADLVWRKKNVYTAHEIAQIVPLINKERTYEKFIAKNSWIFDYWPNAVRTMNYEPRTENHLLVPNFLFTIPLLEKLAFWIQYWYMKSKITNEKVTPTRALFHPVDWSGKVEKQFYPGNSD